MLELNDIFIAFQFAVAAYVICCVLTREGEILERYQDFLDWLSEDVDMSWLAKPLGACEKCLAGQAALWYFVLGGSMYKGIIGACFAILFAIIIKVSMKKMK